METTLIKKVKASTIEEIFDKSEILSIRWYNATDLTNEDDFDPCEKYIYEIVVRHAEETDAEILLDSEIKRVEL